MVRKWSEKSDISALFSRSIWTPQVVNYCTCFRHKGISSLNEEEHKTKCFFFILVGKNVIAPKPLKWQPVHFHNHWKSVNHLNFFLRLCACNKLWKCDLAIQGRKNGQWKWAEKVQKPDGIISHIGRKQLLRPVDVVIFPIRQKCVLRSCAALSHLPLLCFLCCCHHKYWYI